MNKNAEHTSEDHVHVEDHLTEELESGDTYSVATSFSIQDGSTAYLALKTGERLLHLSTISVVGIFSWIECKLCEAAKLEGGTVLTFQNRKRSRKNNSGCMIYAHSKINELGTELDRMLVLSPGNRLEEIILKPNTQYLFVLVNKSGRNNYANIRIQGHVD